MMPVQASQFEPLFDQRLSKYDADQNDLKKEDAEQSRLLSRVSELNLSFQSAKSGDSSSKERETALQNLENAYTTYKEIMGNLEKGRKFYNELSAITTRFRDECGNFVYARRTEAQELEGDLETRMAGLALQSEHQKNLLGERERQEKVQRGLRSQGRVGADEGIAAPTPQRISVNPPAVAGVKSPVNGAGGGQGGAVTGGTTTWKEGMPIVFGGGKG
jgi:programmed cell death 6-interacting protein